MSEHVTVDENKQSIMPTTPTPPRPPRHLHVARHASNILSPVTISFPFIILVALHRTSNVLASLGYALLTLFFLTVGPMAYIIIGVRTGQFTDTDVSVRSQRFGPFLFGIGSALIGLVVLFLIHAPKNLETVLIITIISGIIMMVTTLWWKISIHASSLSGAATMLIMLYGIICLPLFLLVIVVSWSRIVLKRHTLAQVTAGSLVSIALASVVLTIRGV